MSNSTKSTTIAISAVTAMLALGAINTASAADFEKCAGIAAAGKNDCGTPVSACAGTVTHDRDAHAWVLVPKGTCAKIAGGVVTTDPMNKHGGNSGK
jgi:uncharacterized membrane protein